MSKEEDVAKKGQTRSYDVFHLSPPAFGERDDDEAQVRVFSEERKELLNRFLHAFDLRAHRTCAAH